MTMRLDIVTNDAGELVRRERARELGAGVVVAVYRLAKLAQMHDLTNQAFVRQLEQTHQIIGDYCLRAGTHVNVLFAHRAVFVAGQLLKGSRGAYEAASELGEIFERLGGSELFIQRDITREELLAFAEQISIGHRSQAKSFRSPTPKIRLRVVNDAARLRGIELEELSPDQRIVRTYASAVVVLRRFFEDLEASRYVLPRRIKRIAQSLVDLSEGSTPAFLGVTEVRNANHDEAGRAVNSAIVAVSMVREITQDRSVLSQVAMAAMVHDVARPRALALAGASGPAMPGMAAPTTLSEDQEDRLPAGAAAVLTALGRVNEPSITRTVLAFEALWLRRQTWIGPVYWGARPPTFHAKVVAVARRFNDLLTPEPGVEPPTADYALARLSDELKEPQDRVVLRLLVSALGLMPLGTTVQLVTGEIAEVIRGGRGAGDKPRIKLLTDPNGIGYPAPIEVELAGDARRAIHRVVSVEGWRKGLELAPRVAGPPQDANSDWPPASVPAVFPPAHVGSSPPGWGDPKRDVGSSIQSSEQPSSASLPSLGSSPSAVAEAMGRMINDSLRPPPAMREPQAERAPGRSKPPRDPTARGNLSATPLPHVLVYMLDHSLTGSVVFAESNGAEDVIHFVGGVPTKIRLARPVALLGEILVAGAVLEQRSVDQAVEGARRLGILFGEYLVGHDLVSREALAWGLEAQLLEKVAHLANMSPDTDYAYYRDLDLLEGWGGGDIPMRAALNPILASVRNWNDRARVRATLNRIGKHPLALAEDVDLSGLALLPEEQATLDLIRSEVLALPVLFKRNVADEEVVSSLVYTLAVTRQFAFKGQKRGPMVARSARGASGPPVSAQNVLASGAIPAMSSVSIPVAAAVAISSPSLPAAAPSTSTPPLAESRPRMPSVPAVSTARRVGEPRIEVAAAGAAVGAPSAPSVRAPRVSVPASSQGVPSAAPRPIAPAARPSTTSRAAPQIRPIASKAPPAAPAATPSTTKKATIVGLQPSAPVEARQSGMPPALAAQRASAPPRLPSLDEDPGYVPERVSVTPPDGKTIAMAAPSFPVAGRAPVEQTRRVVVPAVRPSTDVAIQGDDLEDAESALEAMTSFRLAEAALQRSDFANAERLAQKAVDGDPTQADYITLLAWVRALTPGAMVTEDAIATMTSVLAGEPGNERALYYRGKLFARTERFSEALADFNELLATNPHHREAAAEVRALKGK